MRKRIRQGGIGLLLCLAIAFGQSVTVACPAVDAVQAQAPKETAQTLTNPDRGFYKAHSITLTGEEDGSALVSAETFSASLAAIEGCALLHLRFDLAAFSSNGQYEKDATSRQGQTRDIPQGTLDSVAATLAEVRKINATAIVRFSYNQAGKTDENGYLNAEPDSTSDIPVIRRHIAQLGQVLSGYKDVLSGIETGMIGPWGEQHSTTLASISDADTLYYNMIEAWLGCDLDGIGLSVRRPLFYRYWANKKYALGLTDDDMTVDTATLKAHPDLTRVGVFNDAYLGSSGDMGTYTNRAVETAWLNGAAETVLFGGEVVVDTKTSAIGNYNNAAYAIYESGVVHTSYLNRNWNERVIGSQNGEDGEGSWETVEYGSLQEELAALGVAYDPVYEGRTAYDYIGDHMGYRLVLKESSIGYGGNGLQVAFTLENVGFGNVIKAQTAQLLFTQGEKIKAAATLDFDVRGVRSGETETYRTLLDCPAALQEGEEYGVYLKLGSAYDETLTDGVGTALRTVAFANENIYDEDLGANRLMTVTLTESAAPVLPDAPSSTVRYCKSAPLTTSNAAELSVTEGENGVSTVRVESDGAIGARVQTALEGHTAAEYPYIIIDYECETETVMSVYYDSGSNCIYYKQTLPIGRHTVVYRTESDIGTLRLYVAHGQSGVKGAEIDFYSVRLASECVLGESPVAEEQTVCYTAEDGTAYAPYESVAAESAQVFTPYLLKMKMMGAGIRLSGCEESSGLRFGTLIDRADYDALTAAFGADAVTCGTLIVPTEYVNAVGTVTRERLEAYCKAQGVALADVVGNGWNPTITDESVYGYYGSIVYMHRDNFARAFTGIAYVRVECGGKTFTVLSDADGSSRSVAEVARRLMADTEAYGALSAANRALVEAYAEAA